MNGPIRRIAIVAMVMFALLLGNITYTIVFRESQLDEMPGNRRVRDEQFGQDRGPILVGNTPVALTTPANDRFRFQREYPSGELYAPITGFYAYDYGTSALEARYNGELAGTDDSLFVRRLLDILTNRPPTGATVQTTINAAAQQAAFEGMGDLKGAVIAQDAKTGAVLALVSTPSYDPNRLASHDIGADGEASQAWLELTNDENQPLRNRAAREIYPPGSTFKLVTAAAALENGHAPDQRWASPDRLQLPGTETYLPNTSPCGGDEVTLEQALKVSCNTAFANVGLALGTEALQAQAERFGFGSPQLNDLNGVISRFPDDPNDAQLAMSSIGQFEVAASPMQMNMVTAAIANDGVVMRPYLVSAIRSENLAPISTTRPQQVGEAMTPGNARVLQRWMQTVVNEGTGRNGRIEGVEVGGKTGSAETTPDAPPYAWYTTYARSGDRTIAVTVFVEEADIEPNDISGGRLAAPIAKRVLEELL
ncbi:peptidoglycan D,D-transpeptidase FtsI family protein [Propionibacteriaceae bacterium Y2011]